MVCLAVTNHSFHWQEHTGTFASPLEFDQLMQLIVALERIFQVKSLRSRRTRPGSTAPAVDTPAGATKPRF
jgi:hypothetical protein